MIICAAKILLCFGMAIYSSFLLWDFLQNLFLLSLPDLIFLFYSLFLISKDSLVFFSEELESNYKGILGC